MQAKAKPKPQRSFLKDSAIYGLSSIITLGVGFMLLPLYTNALSTADFGLYEILNQTANVLFILIYMGTVNSFVRFYFDGESLEWKKTVAATSVVFNLCSFFLIAATILALKDILVIQLIKDERAYFLIDLLLIWMLTDVLYNLGTAFLQINKLPHYYFAAHATRAAIFVGLNIYFLVFREGSIQEILTSNIVAAGLYGCGFLLFIMAWTRFKISFPLLKELLKYGLPYLPAALLVFVVNGGERFFLNNYAGLSDVGIYSLASKIGLIGTMLLSQAFSKVWGPFVFDKYKEPGGDEEIAHIYHNYAKLLVIFALCVAFSGPIVIPLIAAPEYHLAGTMVSLVCLAAIIQGLAFAADTGLLIAKKTQYKILVGLAGAIAAIFANTCLTSNFGMIGAALSYAFGWLAILIANVYFSNKFYKLPIDWLNIAKGIVAATATYICFYAVLITVEFRSEIVNIIFICLLSLVCLCLFLALSTRLGFIKGEDYKYVLRLSKRFLPVKIK